MAQWWCLLLHAFEFVGSSHVTIKKNIPVFLVNKLNFYLFILLVLDEFFAFMIQSIIFSCREYTQLKVGNIDN